MTEAAHSYWSASKFESLMLCPGKLVLEDGLPDTSSEYAAEGTAAHLVLTWALQEDRPAFAYVGRTIHLDKAGRRAKKLADIVHTFEVDDEMATHVQVCVDYCHDVAGYYGAVLADQRVNYSSYLGVDTNSAWGTADVIIFRDDELVVVDFKYGRGVEVDAEKNPQMSLYALGALQAYQGVVADFARVRMVISQPRLRYAPSEWDCSVEELEAWGRSTARSAVATCINATKSDEGPASDLWREIFLRPSEKACNFCKAKATCPALRAEVAATIGQSDAAAPDEFESVTVVTPGADTDAAIVSACLAKVDLIEDWCKAVRAEAERRLLAGQRVPGFKLVQGKKSARQWEDDKAAEQALKAMRLKVEDMYDLKLISPTRAEKLHKAGTIGPRQWPKITALITQRDGKAHVAPESDSRPAIEVKPVIEEFTDLTSDLA